MPFQTSGVIAGTKPFQTGGGIAPFQPEEIPAGAIITSEPIIDESIIQATIQKTEGRKYKGFFNELGMALARSSSRILASGLQAVERISAPGSVFEPGAFERLAEPLTEFSKSAKVQPSTEGGVRGFVANAVGEALPFTAATVASVLITGTPFAAFATSFVVEGESARQEALAAGASEEDADLEAFVVGTINGALEKLQVDEILRFSGVGKTSIRAIIQAARNKSFKKIAKEGGKLTLSAAKSAITEGTQEALQETTSVLAPKVTGRDVIPLKEAIPRIGQAFLGGAVVGPILSGGVSVFKGNTIDKKLAENIQKRAEKFVKQRPDRDTTQDAVALEKIVQEETAKVDKAGEKVVPPISEALQRAPMAERPVEAKVPTKQIEVSDADAAKLLGQSLEKIKAVRALKEQLRKELVITEFQPSDFVPKAKKGPGLTRAEQQLVTPTVQGKLRFAQTQGLPVGFKAGQKEANDIAKRRLDDFRTARKVEKDLLQDARKLVTEYAKDPVVAKKLITSLANVNSPAKLSAFADKLGEFVKEAERKQAIASYKTTFKELKRANRLGKVNFGKLRPAARERILKFADTIDLQKLSVAKRGELESLMKKVKDLGVDLSEGVAVLDVDTQDALKQLDPHIVALERLQKTAISDMGLEEIQIAEDSLKYIIRQNEIQNKLVFENRTKELAETENQAVKEISISEKQKKIFAREIRKGIIAPLKKTGVLAKGKEGLITQSETIPTLIQISTIKGATAAKDVLDIKTHDGLRETNRIQFESVDFLKKQYAKHNITPKTLDSFDSKFEVVIGKKKRSVTADDLAAIEMHLRSLDNIEQLRKTEALVIQGRTVKDFTIQELVDAVEKLTPSQIKILDITNAQNRKITAPEVNKASENLWGYSIATDVNYWPRVRELPRKVGGTVIDFSTAVEQQSPFQPRTGGTQPIIIVPFRQQMWQTIQTGARFGGSAIPFHNARGLLNSKKWQNAMIEAGRKPEMNAIIKIFRRTQGISSDKNALELSFQAPLSNIAKSKLSLRPSTPLVQAASFPVFFSEIPAKYAFPLKGFKTQTGKTQLARLKKFSATLRLRFEGGRMSPEVGNISASEGLKMLVFNKVSLTTKPLTPLRIVDRRTILEGDKMIQRMIRDTTNLKGDAFWKAVSLKTEEITRLTQPMWDHLDRSVNLTSPNILLRAGLAFRAPREAMLNVAIRGRDALSKGEKAKFVRSWSSVFSSILMARFIKLGVKIGTVGLVSFLIRGRVPRREKEFSDFVADIAKDTINIIPFGEIINPAVDVAIKGKTWREAELNNLLGDFVTTAAKVVIDGTKSVKFAIDGDTEKAKKSLGKALSGTIQTIAEVKGLPFTGPRDIIRPALKEDEVTGAFGRTTITRTTRTRTTRTRQIRTFGGQGQ